MLHWDAEPAGRCHSEDLLSVPSERLWRFGEILTSLCRSLGKTEEERGELQAGTHCGSLGAAGSVTGRHLLPTNASVDCLAVCLTYSIIIA